MALQITVGIAAGSLTLAQASYSSFIQKKVLGLPRRKWNGVAWVVPIADLSIVRSVFAGFINESPEVSAMGRPAHVHTGAGLGQAADVIASSRPALVVPVIHDYVFKTSPFDHQRIGFDLARRKAAFALLMEMGTGKTKTTIDVLSDLVKRNLIDGVIVICPLAVVLNWETEFEVHSPLTAERRRAIVMMGSSTEKALALKQGIATGCSVFITNFATLLKLEGELESLLRSRRMAIVVDESTFIANHKAKTSKALFRLGPLARARYILTGTPVDKDPLTVFGQFYFLDPNILGHHNYYSFRGEYGVLRSFDFQGTGKKQPKVVDYKNLDRLRDRIAAHSYRVLKKDCLDLPPKVYQTLELPMGPQQASLYQRMKKDAVVTCKGHTVAAPLVVTRMLRQSQITSGFLPELDLAGRTVGVVEIEDEVKTPACLELVREAVANGQKFIVWSRFLRDIEKLEVLLAAEGIRCVTYHGDVGTVQRQQHVDAFQADKDVMGFLGQTQTGGIAITLTASSLVIYFQNTYRLIERLQSEDRAHRIGQTKSVLYVDLVCRGSIDKHVRRALDEKKDFADIVTGDNIGDYI